MSTYFGSDGDARATAYSEWRDAGFSRGPSLLVAAIQCPPYELLRSKGASEPLLESVRRQAEDFAAVVHELLQRGRWQAIVDRALGMTDVYQSVARQHDSWGFVGVAVSWLHEFHETALSEIHSSDIESVPSGTFVPPDLLLPESVFPPIDFDGLILAEEEIFDSFMGKFADPTARAELLTALAAVEESPTENAVPDEWTARIHAYERWTGAGFSRHPAMLIAFASAPPEWLIPSPLRNRRAYVRRLRRESRRFSKRASRLTRKGHLSRIETVSLEAVTRLFAVARLFRDEGMAQVVALTLAVYEGGNRPYPRRGSPEWVRDYAHLGPLDIGYLLAAEVELYSGASAGADS
jgi:hypothetical protein